MKELCMENKMARLEILTHVIFLICLIFGFTSKAFSLEAEIVTNYLNIQKEMISKKDNINLKQKKIYWTYKHPDWMKNWNERKGHLKKLGKDVSIISYSGHPDSRLKCFSKDGNVLWSKTSHEWPTNNITSIAFNEDNHETTIMVLLHGKDLEYIILLNEEGATKKIISLMSSKGKYFLEVEPFYFNNEKYFLFHGYDDAIIYDCDGKITKPLKTPVVTGGTITLELNGENNNKYLAIYVIHKFSTHSATLFILSSKMEILYEEHITKRKSIWIGTQQGHKNDNLIVYALEDQDNRNEDPKEIIVKYSIGK